MFVFHRVAPGDHTGCAPTIRYYGDAQLGLNPSYIIPHLSYSYQTFYSKNTI